MTVGVRSTREQQLDSGVRWLLRHWLLLANSLVLLYSGVPWLSPLAHSLGYHWLGKLFFLIYTPLCHQKPTQSFFFNGYQVAFCERETVMYTTLLAGGIVFGMLRNYIRPIPIWAGLLLLLPMIFDGGTQLIDDLLPQPFFRGLNDTIGSFNFWMRLITGLLFAIAVVLTAYPRFERDLRAAQMTTA